MFDFVEFYAICLEYFETKIAKKRPSVATSLTAAKCVHRTKIRLDNFVRVGPKPPKRQTKGRKRNGAPDRGRQNRDPPRKLVLARFENIAIFRFLLYVSKSSI